MTASPTCVVAFDNGEVCRMTTWHPTGIKLACADYESRIKLPPPAITAVHFEADGVALVPYTADEIAKVLAND